MELLSVFLANSRRLPPPLRRTPTMASTRSSARALATVTVDVDAVTGADADEVIAVVAAVVPLVTTAALLAEVVATKSRRSSTLHDDHQQAGRTPQ